MSVYVGYVEYGSYCVCRCALSVDVYMLVVLCVGGMCLYVACGCVLVCCMWEYMRADVLSILCGTK